MRSNYFDFEKTDVYTLAVAVNRTVATMRWPTGRSHLKDQAVRAADSMVLNIAEGWERGRNTRAGRNHFRIAKGSAGEVFAVLDILATEPEARAHLQRIGSMIHGLSG